MLDFNTARRAKLETLSYTSAITNFGVKDAKGREIGGQINFARHAMHDYIEGHYGHYLFDPVKFAGATECWSFRPQATRDGVPYGASQSRKFYLTEAEAIKASEEYLADARKRAAKR